MTHLQSRMTSLAILSDSLRNQSCAHRRLGRSNSKSDMIIQVFAQHTPQQLGLGSNRGKRYQKREPTGSSIIKFLPY